MENFIIHGYFNDRPPERNFVKVSPGFQIFRHKPSHSSTFLCRLGHNVNARSGFPFDSSLSRLRSSFGKESRRLMNLLVIRRLSVVPSFQVRDDLMIPSYYESYFGVIGVTSWPNPSLDHFVVHLLSQYSVTSS